MTNLNRDERIIQNITESGIFQKEKEINSDKSLVNYIVANLEKLYNSQAIIVTLTGGPGSGKSTLRENIINSLQMNGHSADYVSTDDFGLYSREERNRLIAEGKINPWTAKDWVLLNMLIDEIREGKSVKAPIYDEATGDAVVVGEANFPHYIEKNLHFLIVEGDFQPVDHVDKRIYFHVPTDVRRENRVVRDLDKRNGGDPEKIKQSFDFRLESQYYPYTITNAEKADLLIVTDAHQSQSTDRPFIYTYTIYTKQ